MPSSQNPHVSFGASINDVAEGGGWFGMRFDRGADIDIFASENGCAALFAFILFS
jgi:hypothetical protein